MEITPRSRQGWWQRPISRLSASTMTSHAPSLTSNQSRQTDDPCFRDHDAVEDEAIVLDGPRLLRLVSGRATPVADLSGIARCGANTMVRMPPPPSRRLGRSDLISNALRKACGVFPGCRIVLRRLDGKGRFFSSTILKRPTPMPPKRRCYPRQGVLDYRRQGERGRHRTAAAFVWQSGQGLSDWRGERAFRADNWKRFSL